MLLLGPTAPGPGRPRVGTCNTQQTLLLCVPATPATPATFAMRSGAFYPALLPLVLALPQEFTAFAGSGAAVALFAAHIDAQARLEPSAGLSCHARESTDLSGDAAFVWGTNFLVTSAAACCQACAAHQRTCRGRQTRAGSSGARATGAPCGAVAAAGAAGAMRGSTAPAAEATTARGRPTGASRTTCTCTAVASAGSSTSPSPPGRWPLGRRCRGACGRRRASSGPGLSRKPCGRTRRPSGWRGSRASSSGVATPCGASSASPAGTTASAKSTAAAESECRIGRESRKPNPRNPEIDDAPRPRYGYLLKP